MRPWTIRSYIATNRMSHGPAEQRPRHLLSRGRNRCGSYLSRWKFSRFPRSEAAMSPAPPAHRDKSGAPFGAAKQSLAAGGGKCTYDMMERDRIGLWGCGDGTSTSRLSGLDRLKHPGLNKVSLPREIVDRA